MASGPNLVADVGNTRIKWGLCREGAVAHGAALPDDPDTWRAQLAAWSIAAPRRWAVAGVHPARRDRLVDWLRGRGHDVQVINHYASVPLTLAVDAPERVGLDRLFNVLAARQIVPAGMPAVVVSAGTAVTVDLLDEEGAFAGGAIFPGLRLMAEALHDHTALLPLVNVYEYPPIVPAKSTAPAIAAGIHWTVVGGVAMLTRELAAAVPRAEPLDVLLTGGDANVIAAHLPDQALYRCAVHPLLTLEGIRIAATTRS